MFNTVLNWSISAILASLTILPVSLNRQSIPTVESKIEEAELHGCATSFGSQGLIPFYYDGPDYSKDEVQKLSNWKHDITPTPTCDQVDERACSIHVDPQYVDSSTSALTLDSSIDLIAEEQDEEDDPTYVKSIASGAGQIFNKSM